MLQEVIFVDFLVDDKGVIHKLCFRQNSNERMMSSTPITVLSLRVGSFCNRSFITFMAGSIGTDVKRADTSQELRHSPGAKVMCLTCSTKSWVLFMWWGGLAN